MLVDATHAEETRVAIVDGNRLEDLDFEITSRKMLKGNIYLAKVIRIEPSLQAAFVEYGGNRHGFLAFTEIHPDYYRIPVGDRPSEEIDETEEDILPAGALQPPTGSDVELDSLLDNNDQQESEQSSELAMQEENIQDLEPEINQTEQLQEESHPVSQQQPPARTHTWAEAAGTGTLNDLLPGFELGSSPTGLITDFGPEPAVEQTTSDQSVETVGGEAAEQARERYVRQARHRYKIQEVVKRRQVMLIQVVKEERGNKGAALTTFLSLAGRYCVLMPNTTHGGGVSRKITSHQDRRRMKEILDQLEIPDGMAVILRTAGMEQSVAEIQHDLDHLLRLWDNIREQTLQSTAPALIYEEANLIKRGLRDLYSNDIQEILVAGERGYTLARDFMRTIMPDAVDRIKMYDDRDVPLFFRYNVENQIDGLHSPVVNLRSGGYIVINPTEALVSIDVNSGRATRERHIEETAVKTNLEAADEIARQLRLRDLAGLVVIDFIDMEDGRHNAAVERRLKEAMKIDRARLQIGRISHFGLLELSRQRLRPSLLETSYEKCPHCAGLGYVRAVESAALSALRAVEEEGIKHRGNDFMLSVPTNIALYLLNQKRDALAKIERRYDIRVQINSDEDMSAATAFKIDRLKSQNERQSGPAVNVDDIYVERKEQPSQPEAAIPDVEPPDDDDDDHREFIRNDNRESGPREGRQDRPPRQGRRGRFGNRRGGGGGGNGYRNPQEHGHAQGDRPPMSGEGIAVQDNDSAHEESGAPGNNGHPQQDDQQRRRRRGRRGGRRRGRRDNENRQNGNGQQTQGPRDRNDNYQPRERDNVQQQPQSFEQSAQPPRERPQYAAPRQHAPMHEAPSRERSGAPAAHEMVNQTPEKPKAGWWRRLTGQ